MMNGLFFTLKILQRIFGYNAAPGFAAHLTKSSACGNIYKLDILMRMTFGSFRRVRQGKYLFP
jgi:hypothetical protein